MVSVSLKIAYFIILTGLFVVVAFMAINYEALNTNFYTVLIPLIVFLFLFGLAVGQKLAFPVKELLKDADYFSKGNVKKRFYWESKDELGQLSKVFNKIAEEFEDQKSKVETLDSTVKLRTKALEEIVDVLERKVKNRAQEFQRNFNDLERMEIHSKIKDQEIAELKKQIAELNAKSNKSPRTSIPAKISKPIKKIFASVQGQKIKLNA